MNQQPLFLLLSTSLIMTGCGQQQPTQHTTNPQYQTNQANPSLDCTPITNPNYVPGGNQAQYYYPEGCQPPVNNGAYPTNGYNNSYPNNSNIGGYVGAAAVGAAAGALANRAMNNRNRQNTPTTVGNNSTNANNRIVVPPINRQTPSNTQTYTPSNKGNSSVYRQNTNRATATSRSSRRR